MTIEEVFNLQPGAGGLHNLLDLHRAFWDEQGLLTLELQVTEQLLNPKGTVHGGTLFALCDSAVGTYITLQNQWAVTLDSTIHFFRPAFCGDTLLAKVFNEQRGARFRPFLLKYIMTKIRALLTPVLPCTTRSRYYFFVIFDVYTT